MAVSRMALYFSYTSLFAGSGDLESGDSALSPGVVEYAFSIC
jgi:hypothetical protein